jgi:hypothetical protein
VFSSGVFSRKIDWICEDYSRVEDNGRVIVTRQWSKNFTDDTITSQYLVGDRIADRPPKGYRLH